jgi:hypothetical protein
VRRIDLALHGLEIIGLPLKACHASFAVARSKIEARHRHRPVDRRLPGDYAWTVYSPSTVTPW